MNTKVKVIMAATAVAIVLTWVFCLPGDLFDNQPYALVVTDRDGVLLGARVADDGQWRLPPGDSIPPKFAKAVIEYEDRSFYTHFGVSMRGIGRALWQNISNRRIVSGGSTITMQTIRLHRRGNRNIMEKIVEMFMATRLEARYSKDEILRMYVSHAPFGGNVVGIDAAVWRYLGNDGNEMSWAEAATLAVLQNAPASIHLAKNRDKLLAKRNRLLKRLYDKGDVAEEEYHLSIDEPLIEKPHNMQQTAPHYVEQINQTRQRGLVRTSALWKIFYSLLRVCAHWRDELSLSGVNDLAAIIIDLETKECVASCGNAGFDCDRPGKWVDMSKAVRSSGSILKPLLYCAALQEGLILEDTLLPDIPLDFGGFAPKNFDGTYQGAVAAKSALAQSLNIPFVWLLKEYGVARFASLLQQSGLSTINKSPDAYGLSLILGGAEVTLEDVAFCYADLARNLSDAPLNDRMAIYQMFDAMRQVGRPDQIDLVRARSMPDIAWKTGTSYGNRDAWAIGITPGYVVAVWAGNADGSGVAGLTGARTAGPVMFDIFDRVLSTHGWFDKPQGALERVCAQSGHRAGKYCSHTRMQQVAQGGAMSKVCPYCTEIPVSADGTHRVTDASEPSVMKSFFELPPDIKYYYVQSHADYVGAPVNIHDAESSMRILYPSHRAVVALPRQADGTRSQLVCKAAHNDPYAQLFWHLDNSYLGSTHDIHQMPVTPSPGVHKLTINDNFGATSTIELVVK